MSTLADRVKDHTASTGTGAITLAGTAPTGFRTFATAFGVGSKTVNYCIDDGAGNWEVGSGTYNGTTGLTRTTVHSSSNANALVTFAAGSKTVFCTAPATLLDTVADYRAANFVAGTDYLAPTGSASGLSDLPTLVSLGAQAAGTYATGTGTASGINTGDQTLPTLVSLGAVASSLVGANSGVASLDSTGKVPDAQLPTPAVSSLYWPKATAGTGSDNVSIGTNALAVNTTGNTNIAIGTGALATNSDGYNNLAFGKDALAAVTHGSNNVAIGNLSMSVNGVNSSGNVAIGYQTLKNIYSGSSNVAIGNSAAERLIYGPNNVAVGNSAGASWASSSCANSTAVGYQSLFSNTTGPNSAIGSKCLQDLTDGNNNSSFGTNSGKGITTGSGNTILGAEVTGLAADLTNNIILASGVGVHRARFNGTSWNFTGSVAFPDGLSVGGNAVTGTNTGDQTNVSGTAGGLSGTPAITVAALTASTGTFSGAVAVTGAITATGNITAYYSDDRLKTNLGTIKNALDKVKALSGFYFEANATAQSLGYEVKREVGVSAQQVQSVMPEVISPAPIDPQYMTVHYDKLIPLLIEAIKELSEIEAIKELRLEIALINEKLKCQ